MGISKFGRKAWASLAVMVAGSSLLVVSFANTDPANCDSSTEAEVTASELENMFVCVRLQTGGDFINRELHKAPKILEAGKEELGTFSSPGNGNNVITYVYNSGGTFKARFCRNSTTNTVRVLILDDNRAYSVQIKSTLDECQ